MEDMCTPCTFTLVFGGAANWVCILIVLVIVWALSLLAVARHAEVRLTNQLRAIAEAGGDGGEYEAYISGRVVRLRAGRYGSRWVSEDLGAVPRFYGGMVGYREYWFGWLRRKKSFIISCV